MTTIGVITMKTGHSLVAWFCRIADFGEVEKTNSNQDDDCYVTTTLLMAVALTVTALIVARPWMPLRVICRRRDIKAAHAERQEMLYPSDRHRVSGMRR